MVLAIDRCRRRQAVSVKQRQVLGGPTAAGAGAAVELEGTEEFVAQERIFPCKRIPFLPRETSLRLPSVRSCSAAVVVVLLARLLTR